MSDCGSEDASSTLAFRFIFKMKTEEVKGFRDFIGEEAEKREMIRKILVENFSLYGFEPAETPIIEYREFVKGENTNDEAVSDIFKLEDRGKRELALRYEFTFQLKRIMAGKKLPFRRYQIGPVFRDEPTTGNRLRQFTQCDIDIIGADIRDEAEVLMVVKKVLSQLGIKFTILINNRALLNEILEKENIESMDFDKVIREIDKMEKLPEDELYNNLRGYGAQNLINVFKQKEKFFEKYENYAQIKRLKDYCELYGVEVKFSPSLARGLSYYNGSVFEVKSDIKETITAGGSYIFNGIQCTGISFGLERLSLLTKQSQSNNKTLIISIGKDKESISLAELLRDNKITCMLSNAKIGKALEFANAKAFNYVIFVGEDEVKNNKFKLRDMKSGKESSLSDKDIIKKLI
jgi:histidyl-tRNA synthetase